jgi:hypothetical protein
MYRERIRRYWWELKNFLDLHPPDEEGSAQSEKEFFLAIISFGLLRYMSGGLCMKDRIFLLATFLWDSKASTEALLGLFGRPHEDDFSWYVLEPN